MIFELNVGYDQSGCYEDQYRNYRRKKMEEIKEIRGEEEVRRKLPTDEVEHDVYGVVRDMAVAPTKNLFDFTYRPENGLKDYNKKSKQEGTKNLILRKMSQMQRDFYKYKAKSNLSNSGVKY